jgi:hypothetical protein
MNLENRKNRGSSHQYMGWMSERISLRLPVAGEVFFLDIPFYRTLLHPFLYAVDLKRALSLGEAQPRTRRKPKVAKPAAHKTAPFQRPA